jgi:protein-S-isoprenylcysteine O-methyltransferase Ste14
VTAREAALSLWVLWLVSWLIAAAWSSRTVKRASIGLQFFERVITGLGAVMLFAQPRGHDSQRWWDGDAGGAWGLTLVVALGLAFAWWARLRLGRLWSGSVTQKEGHRVVETGPYAIVRHPIYTGLLLSAFATAALEATWLGFAGAALVALGFYLKARLEERLLRGELGAAYDEYRRRIPMLIPFLGSQRRSDL